jgi:hypothetical protein
MAYAKVALFKLEAERWDELSEQERRGRASEADALVAELGLLQDALNTLERKLVAH